jgi:hypothetical protein
MLFSTMRMIIIKLLCFLAFMVEGGRANRQRRKSKRNLFRASVSNERNTCFYSLPFIRDFMREKVHVVRNESAIERLIVLPRIFI